MKNTMKFAAAWTMSVLFAAACASPGQGGETTVSGGSGGAPNDGGAVGGSKTGEKASSSASGTSEPECPGEANPDLLVGLPACPSYLCAGAAHCVPKGVLDAIDKELVPMLKECNAESVCVPDNLIETAGNFLLTSCTAILGMEGRCLSPCIPEVAERGEYLDRDICGEFELCVPCYDPLTGESTGACDLGCGPGPTEPAPPPAATCCTDGGGTCVPKHLIPPAQVGSLGKDVCPEPDQRCVPNQLLDSNWDPEPCAPSTILIFAGIDEGVCMPSCVEAVKSIGAGSCDDGYKCAPCEVFGKPTGACEDG